MSGFQSDLQVLHEIANGHFGKVYLGQDPAHGPVAVKVLAKRTQNGLPIRRAS